MAIIYNYIVFVVKMTVHFGQVISVYFRLTAEIVTVLACSTKVPGDDDVLLHESEPEIQG